MTRSRLVDGMESSSDVEDGSGFPAGVVPYVGDKQPNVSPTAAARPNTECDVRNLDHEC